MKIGSIFTLGGWFLLVVGGLCVFLFGKPLLFDKGGTFSNLLAVLILGVIPIAAGLGLVSAGRRRSKLEVENDERGILEVVMALARKSGGQITIDEVSRATSLPSDEAQAKMRALVGRGVFDLDFDGNGQMVYKLSADKGRAELAQLAQK